MRRPATLLLSIALVALAPALGACGDDESGGPSTIASSAAPERPVALTGEATTIQLDPLTVGLLDDNNITAAPIPPARQSARGVRFPIVGGEIRPATFGGKITLSGGLAFTKGTRRVLLRDFVLNTSSGQLTANAGAGRLPLLNFDFSSGKRLDAGSTVALVDVPTTLTSGAAHALSEALEVSVFTPSLQIGSAAIRVAG